jgi:hypothetical protein
MIASLDVELCDCFVEYGATTAEMALMLAFVLFGTSLIWEGLALLSVPVLLFTVAAIFLRPVAMLPSLAFSSLSWRDRKIIAWFGPRGLSSLLLVLLPVFAGIPGSHWLLQVCCLVVLVSVVLHGFSPRLLLGPERAMQPPSQPQEPQVPAPENVERKGDLPIDTSGEFLTLEQFDKLAEQGIPFRIIDGRSDASHDASDQVIPGAYRISPADVRGAAAGLDAPKNAVLAVLCA